jgi:hypothetical protein
LQKPGLATQNMIGIQACFLPETSLSPGIGFGMRDIACQSPEGIGPYAVVTRHFPVGESSPLIKGFAATFGIGAFGIRGPFCGFEPGPEWHRGMAARKHSQDKSLSHTQRIVSRRGTRAGDVLAKSETIPTARLRPSLRTFDFRLLSHDLQD